MSDHQNGNGNGVTSPMTTALARAVRREDTALVVDQEEYHLDQEMMRQWIFDKSDPKQKRLQCESFLLVHDKKDGPDSVTTAPTIPKKISAEDRMELIRVLVAEFADESETRTAMYPDRQRFKVCGYLKEPVENEDRSQDPICTRSFLVSPPEASAASFHQADAPSTNEIDGVAIVGQLQRLVDVSVKQLAQNLQSTQDRLLDWNQSVMKRSDELEERSFKRAMEMEKLLDDRARRDAEATEKRMHVDAQWQVIQGALSYAKAFGDQYLAKKGMVQPGAEDAANNQLAMLGETFEPVQLVQILAMLRPEQEKIFAPIAMGIVAKMPPDKQQMVGALLEMHQAEKAKRAAAAEAAQGIKVTVQQTPGAGAAAPLKSAAPSPKTPAAASAGPTTPSTAPAAPSASPTPTKKGEGK